MFPLAPQILEYSQTLGENWDKDGGARSPWGRPPPRGPCDTKCLETTTPKLASPSTPEFKKEQFHLLLSDVAD